MFMHILNIYLHLIELHLKDKKEVGVVNFTLASQSAFIFYILSFDHLLSNSLICYIS